MWSGTYIKMKRPFVQCSAEPDNIHMGSAWLHVGESGTPERKRDKTTKQTHVKLDEFCG
jgi:hypothetical protein